MILYQLPSGNWISLAEVIGVHFLEAAVITARTLPPRVRIDSRSGQNFLEEFTTSMEAVAFRDKLAKACNDFGKPKETLP